jgi:3-phenylpropionate/trans-cinnamate dioxygenase ferredoxin reductase subunit
MSNQHVKYLLIGGGLASISAAEAIRDIDTQGQLLIIGQEINRPYHRPPLSKQYLRREQSHEQLFTHSASWYRERSIALRTGLRGARLDTARHSVALDNGEEVSFDRLLLATGALPRHMDVPGADLPNLFYLRTIEDVERLHHAMEQVERMRREKAHVVIIGGGVLGVELSASLKQMGLAVDLVLGADHPWSKFAGEASGKFISHYLESKGVIVHSGPRPLRFEGDGRVQRIVLNDKTIACDFAVAAVGAVPNRELLRGTTITAEKAILVNERCQTNVEGIYAAGDCCAIFDPLFGKHRILDHWDGSIVTGKLAGTNMAGVQKNYDAVSVFFSDVFDLTINVWGEPRLVDRRIVRGIVNVEHPDFIEIGLSPDSRITQILALNHPSEDDLLRELVKRRLDVTGKEEMLKEPGMDLKSLIS